MQISLHNPATIYLRSQFITLSKIVLYAPGREYTVYSYLLHNGKKRLEAFFPFCRYPTKESIRQRFDTDRSYCIHDLSDDSYYFRYERTNQLGRFVNYRDFILHGHTHEGDFSNSKEFEFKNPRVSGVTKKKKRGRKEKGWTCFVTENPAHPDYDQVLNTSPADSGDDENPHECFEYSD